MNKYLASAGLVALLAFPSSASHAQERSRDNALDQADDAFGLSVGRESIGIYTANNTRGFSPTAAGNVRINGLYFDPLAPLPGLIVDSTSVRVGLSAQGYPFSAPSGVVDQSLRVPGDAAGASLVMSGDSFGSGGAEWTGSVPVTSTLSLGFGLAGNHVEFADGTSNWNHDQALIARWTPAPGVEIMPFWTLSNDYDDEAGTVYVPPAGTLPPKLPLGVFVGPDWVDLRYIATTHGLVSTVRPSRNWAVRLGFSVPFSTNRANFPTCSWSSSRTDTDGAWSWPTRPCAMSASAARCGSPERSARGRVSTKSISIDAIGDPVGPLAARTCSTLARCTSMIG